MCVCMKESGVMVRGSVLCFRGFGLASLGKVCRQCWPNLICKPSAAMSGPAFKASTDFHWSPDHLLLSVVNRPPCLNSSLIFFLVIIFCLPVPQSPHFHSSPDRWSFLQRLTCFLVLGALDFLDHSPPCLSASGNTCHRTSLDPSLSGTSRHLLG